MTGLRTHLQRNSRPPGKVERLQITFSGRFFVPRKCRGFKSAASFWTASYEVTHGRTSARTR